MEFSFHSPIKCFLPNWAPALVSIESKFFDFESFVSQVEYYIMNKHLVALSKGTTFGTLTLQIGAGYFIKKSGQFG